MLPEFDGQVLDLARSAGSYVYAVPQPDGKPPVKTRLKTWFVPPGTEFYGQHSFGLPQWATSADPKEAQKTWQDAKYRWANGTRIGVAGHCADVIVRGWKPPPPPPVVPDVAISGSALVSSTQNPSGLTCEDAIPLPYPSGSMTINIPAGVPGLWFYVAPRISGTVSLSMATTPKVKECYYYLNSNCDTLGPPSVAYLPHIYGSIGGTGTKLAIHVFDGTPATGVLSWTITGF